MDLVKRFDALKVEISVLASDITVVANAKHSGAATEPKITDEAVLFAVRNGASSVKPISRAAPTGKVQRVGVPLGMTQKGIGKPPEYQPISRRGREI